MAVLIGIVLFPAAISDPERNRLPTLLADVVTLSEVRRTSEIGVISELGASRDTLLAERGSEITAPLAKSCVADVQADAELTPTMKVKRAAVYERYADTFASLYEGGGR